MLFGFRLVLRAKSGDFRFSLIPPSTIPYSLFSQSAFLFDISAGEPMRRFPTQRLHDHRGDVRHGSRLSPAGSSYLQRDLGANNLPGFRYLFPDFELRLFFVLLSRCGGLAGSHRRTSIPFSRTFLRQSLHHRAYPIFPILLPKISAPVPIEKRLLT